MRHYLALDLGAESGRAILGSIDEGKLKLQELHRFENTPVQIPQGLYWDTLRLWHEMQEGMRAAGARNGLGLSGIGVDTWGVDFGLFGADGSLVDNPRHYRDARNNGILDKLFAAVPRQEVFAHTGIQFMQINSLCQLYAAKLSGASALPVVSRLLMMPDIFNYWLTGVGKAELTIASTSQMYNPAKRRWAAELVEKLGLPASILPEIVPPGTLLGPIRPEVAAATGLAPDTPVFATASHDTASAVAAVPAQGADWCYISSGTWSLMGVELDEPVMNEQALAENLTNEVGAEGRIRLLKNIAGMWPLQECRRAWAREGHEYTYGELAEMAEEAAPFSAVIDPDAFLEPGRMPERIAEYCKSTGQAPPDQPAGMVRVIFESLALRYREVLEGIERLLGRKLRVIHIVGGGSRNRLLNQLVADAAQRVVVAGPTEATAAGNVLVQAVGSGLFSGLAEARAVVRASFPVESFEPQGPSGWDEAYERFRKLRG